MFFELDLSVFPVLLLRTQRRRVDGVTERKIKIDKEIGGSRGEWGLDKEGEESPLLKNQPQAFLFLPSLPSGLEQKTSYSSQ